MGAAVLQGLARPLIALEEARGRLFGFVPVFLALGIGLWFALPYEPEAGFYLATVAGLAACLSLARFGPGVLAPLVMALACCLAGIAASGLRAHLVAAPMLEYRYYGPVQGRIIAIDRSQSDALRLTLDHVVLEDTAPARVPATVRVALRGQAGDIAAEPGQVVILTAWLSAPEGPAEPGGFDFRRMAYFNRLGAVGYTASPVLIWEPPREGDQVINRLRTHLSQAIMAALPGDAGAFASGVMTGDRSGISLATVEALRDSNLAHLLAISGMNMAFLTGFVFFLLRYGLALIPPVALRVNSKKVAAVAAFGVALFYLLLSGANVATERAFLMVCVMLGAVLFDRRALTLRSVALAAVLLLLAEPESLAEPGFQLSFAATVVLIAGFGLVEQGVLREKLPRWMIPLFTLVLTSVLAGAATAPFAAAHFNRFTDYGLIANLLTVPVMSLLMAAGAMAALLAPFGLAFPALWVMEAASRWILFIAHLIAGLEGAVTPIIAPGPLVIPLMAMGGLWVVIWQGRVRWAGAVPVVLALLIWTQADRPALLISADGALAGLMGAEGRALSKPNGGSFAAESWLENDGDLALQPDAATRPGFTGPATARIFALAGFQGVALSGKGALAAVPAACEKYDLVILPASFAPPEPRPGPCLLIDRNVLDQTGAIAVTVQGNGLRLTPARAAPRIWRGPKSVFAAQDIALPTLAIAAGP